MPSSFDTLKFAPQQRKRRGSYLLCEKCKREFYVTPSRVRQAERNGTAIRYCSKGCYVKTGLNNPFFGKKHAKESIAKMAANPSRPKFKTGEENPNFSRFGEDFVPTSIPALGSSRWRKQQTECEKCGYSEYPEILQIHHKDRNRSNNSYENLAILCPTCHNLDHYLANDGVYSTLRRQLKRRG